MTEAAGQGATELHLCCSWCSQLCSGSPQIPHWSGCGKVGGSDEETGLLFRSLARDVHITVPCSQSPLCCLALLQLCIYMPLIIPVICSIMHNSIIMLEH